MPNEREIAEIEAVRVKLIAWLERYSLPVSTRIDREMTADALIADFIEPRIALRAKDREDGAREMRERAVECARYRVELAAMALQGGNDGRHRNLAVRDTAQSLRLEIAALPLAPKENGDA